MNRLLIIGLALVFISACATSNRMLSVKDENLIEIKEDKQEYEAVVLDPGFESWFQTTWSPAKDRSLSYYKNWNQQYVTTWNLKATQPHTYRLFDNTIQYDPTTDYGMAVERKLFYYFRWVETKLNIPILANPPRGGIL
jgi:hypothetical protein